jgi:DNA-directed RNA polymerase subunit RPC12/RpoP
VSFLRGIDGSHPGDDQNLAPHEERRRPIRRGVFTEATLACEHCDAPVALGGRSLSITDELSCPYCDHAGLVRDFLSLERPTRPARVEIRVVLGAPRSGGSRPPR